MLLVMLVATPIYWFFLTLNPPYLQNEIFGFSQGEYFWTL